MINKLNVVIECRLLSDNTFRQKVYDSTRLQTFIDFVSAFHKVRHERKRKFCFLSPREKNKKDIRNACAHLAHLAARLPQAFASWAAKRAKFSDPLTSFVDNFFSKNGVTFC